MVVLASQVFFAMNRALFFKWVWPFLSQTSSLWTRTIKAIHGEKRNLGAHGNITERSHWIDIVREINVLRSKGIDFLPLIRKKADNGEGTLFWEDSWFDGISLKQQFPHLYSLESAKHINVAEKMNHPSLSWSYLREPRGGIEEEQQNMIFSRISGVILPNMRDRWICGIRFTPFLYMSCGASYLEESLTMEDNILEKFKIIVQRKVFVIRAKELFVWSPEFKDAKDTVYCSDDESDKGDVGNVGSKDANCQNMNLDAESDVEGVSDTYFGNVGSKDANCQNMNLVAESNVEGVSDTYFGEQEENLVNDHAQSVNGDEHSSDPFNIYDTVKKHNTKVNQSRSDTSITHPPGFTSEKERQNVEDHTRAEKGGSILEVLDDMIKVGQTMRFTMEGCLKDMESIIGSQGDREGFQ
nr:RNA-directed DNA polymerase, eukaryota, reverse transcriptase zinc-binding domain protein [Tanacetum cinerariifolium]